MGVGVDSHALRRYNCGQAMKYCTHHKQRIVVAGLVALAAGPLVACSVLPSTHVVAFGTPYYVDGLDQPGPPDGWLERGTKVWVLREKDTYSYMFDQDANWAWVWSQSLMTARAYAKEEEARAKGRQAAGQQFRPK